MAPLLSVILAILLFAVGFSNAVNPLILRLQSKMIKGQLGFVTYVGVGNSSNDVEFEINSAVQEFTISQSQCKNKSSAPTSFFFSSVMAGDLLPGPLVQLKSVKVKCSDASVAALGSTSTSFPSQIFAAAKLPRRFAYCYVSTPSAVGQLAFGRTNYFIFNHSLVELSRRIDLTYIPLKTSDGYQLKLTAVKLKSLQQQEEIIYISANVRYTQLAGSNYRFLRQELIDVAASKNIANASTSFGELDLCYKMSASQLKTFPNIVMLFGTIEWTVSPYNYLVPHPNAKNVACFGIVHAFSRGLGVIGTFQQENNFIEYDLEKKTLGFSGSLVANFEKTCASTFGS